MCVAFRENHGLPFHADLFFELGPLQLQADTYYFELDHPATEPGGVAAVRRSLGELLRQWIERLTSQVDGSTIYLPFDYSDQYTGVIVVTRAQDFVEVRSGWSDLEGYAHNPSDVGDFDSRATQIRTTEDAGARVPRAEFIGNVESSLEAITGAV